MNLSYTSYTLFTLALLVIPSSSQAQAMDNKPIPKLRGSRLLVSISHVEFCLRVNHFVTIRLLTNDIILHTKTLAEDFVDKLQPFDFNAIIRQEDLELRQEELEQIIDKLESEEQNRGKKKKGDESKKNKDGHGAWRTTQCIASGEECYIGDSCCNGGKCPACNIGPCTC